MSTLRQLALASSAVAVTVVAQVMQIRDGAPMSFVVTDTAVAAAFVLAGLGAWRFAPDRPIGTVSVVASIAWQIGTLAMATREEPLTYPLFAASGYHDVALAWLLLAYPAGRVGGRLPRLAVGAVLAGYGFGTVVRATTFEPAAWGCGECPANPMAIIDDEQLFVSLQDWTGRWIGSVLLVIGVITVWRWVTRSVPARRAAGIVPFAGCVWAALYVQDTWLRPADALVIPDPAAFYVSATARGAIPVGIAAGLLALRFRRSRLAELFTLLGSHPRRDELEPVLRSVLGDPTLELWWLDPETGTYARAVAPDARMPTVEPGRHQTVTPLRAGAHVTGILRHDLAGLGDDAYVAAVRAAVELVADNARLAEQVREQLDEVKASRARILAAAASERARLERDLHDGSQQRLVGLALQLRMVRGIVDRDAQPELADSLDQAAKELGEALADLRELARGIHPAALTDGGLPVALPLLAARSSVPTTVDILLDRRLAPAVEATVYFVVSEALTNVTKHSDASACSVRLSVDDGLITLSVCDDGRGGADARPGGGLDGLRDRVEALAGTLAIVSDPEGTRLTAVVPTGERGNAGG